MSQPTLNSGEKSVQRCRTNKFLTIKVFKLKFNSHLLPSWFITHLVKKSEEEKNKPQLSERSGNSLKVEITAEIKKFLHLQYSTPGKNSNRIKYLGKIGRTNLVSNGF